jgi:glycosyltransferase involved in cell wall biosynthesis
VALRRATVLVYPSRAEGFGLSVIEAFALGTPVIHSDAPALLEVAADAGIAVPLAEPDGYPERLAEAVARVVGDDQLRATMRTLGQDRARAFSWTASAEKVWQLHADL